MRGRASGRSCGRNFGWPQAKEQLASGVAPKVVAARLGVSEEFLINHARNWNWPVAYRAPTADDLATANRFVI